jgi:hypothetical protein
MLNSSIAYNKPTPLSGLSNLIQFSEEDRLKMERAGCLPSNIDCIESENDASVSSQDEQYSQ